MSGSTDNRYDKEYEAFRLFEQIQDEGEEIPQPAVHVDTPDETILREDIYCEIEYDSIPLQGESVGGRTSASYLIPEPERMEERPKDEVRELFNRMRDIGRENRYLNFGSRRFFDRKMLQENAGIFYRQGMMMKDFEDEYEKTVPYSSYFSDYQMMGYDQLRTYFTWRTQIRLGNITHLSLSYAFVYLYELLNNIGVDNPREGLERLMLFWDAYRVYDATVDKYVVKWLKDYHIYYELEQSFQEFVRENELAAYYPNLSDSEDPFALFCSVSKYDIKNSTFYKDGKEDLVRRCFCFVLDALRQAFSEKGKIFDDLVFCPVRKMAVWTPFQDALFYPARRQADRKVVLSSREIYVCTGNQWTFSAVITAESGKRLVGYVMKQTEALLRKLTHYKHKLSANLNMISDVMADELEKDGIFLEKLIEEAVAAFYREETRTVVRVNPGRLEQIRREALVIQEKLIVPEETAQAGPILRMPEREDGMGEADFSGSSARAEEEEPPLRMSKAMKETSVFPEITAKAAEEKLNEFELAVSRNEKSVKTAEESPNVFLTGADGKSQSDEPGEEDQVA
ncbi:MAG: hypothetical protein HFH87_12935, partial [Lachnospiraceae bacterium]|nr:hypothetical protein [Lachnospiraceae bacterium]